MTIPQPNPSNNQPNPSNNQPDKAVFPNIQLEIDRIRQGRNSITVARDKTYHTWLDKRLDSGTCGVVISEKRSGTSESSEFYMQNRTKYRSGIVLLLPAPVFHFKVPPGCNQKTLFIALLNALHRNLTFGSLDVLRGRVKATLREYKVKMLIIDDAQHLRLKVLLELVQFFETLKISIILSGTDYLKEKLVSHWKGLHNTFEAKHQFPAMTQAELSEYVSRWMSDFLKWDDQESDLTYEDVLNKLHRDTKGLRGLLDDRLKSFAVEAIKKGTNRIDDQTINEDSKQDRCEL